MLELMSILLISLLLAITVGIEYMKDKFRKKKSVRFIYVVLIIAISYYVSYLLITIIQPILWNI